MTSDNKHFVTVLQINKNIVKAAESITPLNTDVISFSWWELVKMVITFKSLTITYMNRATPFGEGRLKNVLHSLQFIPVKLLNSPVGRPVAKERNGKLVEIDKEGNDVQSQTPKPNYSDQEKHWTAS